MSLINVLFIVSTHIAPNTDFCCYKLFRIYFLIIQKKAHTHTRTSQSDGREKLREKSGNVEAIIVSVPWNGIDVYGGQEAVKMPSSQLKWPDWKQVVDNIRVYKSQAVANLSFHFRKDLIFWISHRRSPSALKMKSSYSNRWCCDSAILFLFELERTPTNQTFYEWPAKDNTRM